ncbi:protein binding [Chrysochromulina tobinii]|uniref:Protein binding n=1 Tax=Chrysochromulina tobinii TaxID=1460289 RepID=A0A0M0J7B7_9EUKA|nr:protein binding [Chrysochromulina tobinii]|eukprot:KOO22252.1 protein binding [Chrysochromulina sp. CCMP291]
MLDRRKHPDRKLLLEGRLASFQGPAICTYNDERFTEKDLASIQSVGNSLKNDADGRTKTGKFGLGFNSCYHVTDCPGLLTGKRLLFLDPSQKHLANGDTGIGFNLHQRHVDSAPDQFAPWRIFGCDPAKEFNGTIFRLPLRTRAHVRGSAGEGISPRPYSLSDADDLLKKFVESLPDLVLFLQYVLLLERKCLRFESGKGAGQWIAPTAAFFPTAEMDHELRSTLMLLELPIVEPPPGVEMLLRSACVHTSSRSGANPNSIAKATPAVVRNHLVTLHSGWEGELNDAQCQELLQYCLSDLCSEALDPASASSAEEKEQARRIHDEPS